MMDSAPSSCMPTRTPTSSKVCSHSMQSSYSTCLVPKEENLVQVSHRSRSISQQQQQQEHQDQQRLSQHKQQQQNQRQQQQYQYQQNQGVQHSTHRQHRVAVAIPDIFPLSVPPRSAVASSFLQPPAVPPAVATMSVVASLQFDSVFGMGSRSSYPQWSVLDSSSGIFDHDPSSYSSDISLSPPAGSRSGTASPPRHVLGLTLQQRDLKRQHDLKRREVKAASRRRVESIGLSGGLVAVPGSKGVSSSNINSNNNNINSTSNNNSTSNRGNASSAGLASFPSSTASAHQQSQSHRRSTSVGSGAGGGPGEVILTSTEPASSASFGPASVTAASSPPSFMPSPRVTMADLAAVSSVSTSSMPGVIYSTSGNPQISLLAEPIHNHHHSHSPSPGVSTATAAAVSSPYLPAGAGSAYSSPMQDHHHNNQHATQLQQHHQHHNQHYQHQQHQHQQHHTHHTHQQRQASSAVFPQSYQPQTYLSGYDGSAGLGHLSHSGLSASSFARDSGMQDQQSMLYNHMPQQLPPSLASSQAMHMLGSAQMHTHHSRMLAAHQEQQQQQQQQQQYEHHSIHSMGHSSPASHDGSSLAGGDGTTLAMSAAAAASASVRADHLQIVQTRRPKPQCWDHGCNGRQFSTFSNLLRHQREKSGQAVKAKCPNCGAEFTRTTARNGHLAHDKCKQRRTA